MRLTRIYQQQPLNIGSTITLSKEAAHHLTRVLRLSVGAEFILFNGKGGEFKSKIISVAKRVVSVHVEEFNPIDRESPLQIILGQSVIRSEKMDYMLQKAVELGVTHIVPLLTERSRSSLKLASQHWEKRLSHWQGIIIAACEQSGRTQIPAIEKPLSFVQAIGEIKADIRTILTPNSTQVLSQSDISCHCVAILVGPEGGWSENETKLAIGEGYFPIQLGPRILRTETAGLVAMTFFQGLFGDIPRNLV